MFNKALIKFIMALCTIIGIFVVFGFFFKLFIGIITSPFFWVAVIAIVVYNMFIKKSN